MPVHVFVDETKERGYLLAAAAVPSADIAAARQAVRTLILPRQRRIHFKSESDARRNKILDLITELDLGAVLYAATGHKDQIEARAASLTRLVEDLATTNVERVVLERDDAAVKADRMLLFAAVRAAGLTDQLRYDHLRAHEDCLLAIPDALAWCWARGGHWRTKVQGIVTEVRPV